MSPRNIVKLVLNVTFWTGCVIGCIFQSKEVWEMYFSYRTHPSLQLKIPLKLTPPSLSVCPVYLQVLNRTDHKKYGLRSQPPQSGKPEGWNEKNLLTIKDIFDLTAKPEDTIDHCYRRSADMLSFDFGNSSQCNQDFRIMKYYMQENICYRYSLKSIEYFSFFTVAHSEIYIQNVYTIRVKDIPPSLLMFIFLDLGDYNLPLLSRTFGKSISRDQDTSEPNIFKVFYQENIVHRLSPPYDTMCTDDPVMEVHECRRLCHIREMKAINRFPSSEMTAEPIVMRHLTLEDMFNETIRKTVNETHAKCENLCTRLKCTSRYATTSVDSYSEKYFKNMTVFYVHIPDSPSNEVTFKALVDLLDFVTYISGSIGTWFGISIASLNPIQDVNVLKYFTKLRKKDNNRIHRMILIMTKQQDKINFLMHHVQTQDERIAAMNARLN